MDRPARSAADAPVTEDARFEDIESARKRLRLRAETADDLPVISTLLQDAICSVGDITWMRRQRRLMVTLNRFRWEDAERAEQDGRPFERVQSILSIEDVQAVRGRGIKPGDNATILSVLALEFDPGDDGAGHVRLKFAAGGELAAEVECLEAILTDLTEPWEAQAKKRPAHDV